MTIKYQKQSFGLNVEKYVGPVCGQCETWKRCPGPHPIYESSLGKLKHKQTSPQ